MEQKQSKGNHGLRNLGAGKKEHRALRIAGEMGRPIIFQSQ